MKPGMPKKPTMKDPATMLPKWYLRARQKWEQVPLSW